MKRKYLILVAILVLSALFAMQSCTKDQSPTPVVYKAAVPALTSTDSSIYVFKGAAKTLDLTWGGDATSGSWDVYFGTDAKPAKVATVSSNAYSPKVTKGGTYYWQVVTVDANNIKSTSEIWSFEVNSKPTVPVLTGPANAATAVSNTAALKWTASDPEDDDLTYDVFFGKAANPGIVASGLTVLTYSPTMDYNTTYYWKIAAHDPYGGVSTSAIYSFTTDVFHPDFSVFKGIFTELCPTTSATRLVDVSLTVNTTTHVITMYLPIANAMLAAGWGTSYTGAHPILITYDPVTLAVTSTNQLLLDSFPDPIEQGPIYLQVSSGSLDPVKKTLSIKWTITPSTPEFGGVVTTGSTIYTLRVQ